MVEFNELKASSNEVRGIMADAVALSKKLAYAMETGVTAIRMVAQVKTALLGAPPPEYKESLQYQEGYQAAMKRIRMAIINNSDDEDEE